MTRNFGPGQVYFIACTGMSAMKIGFTRQGVANRLLALQTGCPLPLRTFGYFPGTIDDERRLHAAFASLRMQGEWFRLAGKLIDLSCYIGECDDRGIFEDAVHDALLQGFWHPTNALSQAEYDATGTASPFAEMLANYVPVEAA